MDGQKSHSNLTRTQSSLLRSSPTIRSSIQSLSSVNEYDHSVSSSDDDEEKKKRKMKRNQPGPAGSFRFISVLTLASITFILFFMYSNVKDEIVTSENFLLALIFVAITLFLANKKKRLIKQTLTVLTNRFRFRLNAKTNGNGMYKPVRWFIDDSVSTATKQIQSREKLTQNDSNEGVEIYSTGDFYEGEFHKGRANGSGVYNFYVNGRYEGDWIDGKYDGFGIESWARGSRYRGQYRKGTRHGFGIYKFYTGDSYAGEWFNGQSHGVGVQTCSDGSCYVGEFKCGVKHGLGCYHFRNDDKYAGEYFGDKVHGFGIYHFANGQCYEGSWHEGRKQGYGLYTFRSGDTKYGEWDCNALKVHLPSLTEPVLRAVQAARKAGDNAINLRSADEQVNKAVMSANRAATAARVAAVKAVQNKIDGRFCDEV